METDPRPAALLALTASQTLVLDDTVASAPKDAPSMGMSRATAYSFLCAGRLGPVWLPKQGRVAF